MSDSKRSGLGGLGVQPEEILGALRRRKWFILLSTLVVGGAVLAGTLRRDKIYQATAQLLIEPMVPQVLSQDMRLDLNADKSREQDEFLNTQYKIITSRVVLAQVIKSLSRQAQLKGFIDSFHPKGEVTDRQAQDLLATRVRVVPDPGSRVVRVVVEDLDPSRAALIANAVGEAYIEQSLESRLETTRNASAWLDEQVLKLAGQLEQKEKRLHEFKRQHLLVSVSLEDRQNMTSASLSMLNQRLIETRAKLIELRAQRSIVRALRGRSEAELASIPRIAENQVIAELRSALVQLDKQRAELSTRYGAKHPSMVALSKQISGTKGELAREVKAVLGALDNEIRALEGAEGELQKAMNSEKSEALSLNSMGLDYNKLTRDLGNTKATYDSLLKRRTEADLSGQLKSNFVRWFEPAEADTRPVRPSIPINTAIGLFLGLALGLLVVIGGVVLDTTVHSRADIEAQDAPFLGVFPSVAIGHRRGAKEQGGKERDLYTIEHPQSSAAECARSLRTNLLFMGTDRSLDFLLLTSARPSEGKTTTCIALGAAMAQAKNRVLIVDTDMRKPRLHKTFGISGERGLTNALVGTPLSEVIQPIEHAPGLDLLPCGPLPPNPSELLHSEAFARVVAELRERYDRVLFDSPPVGAVTDASILSKAVDGTILVAEANSTPKEAMRRALSQLRAVDANLLGVVLNNLDLGSGEYGYQDYYQYRGYRYREDDKSS